MSQCAKGVEGQSCKNTCCVTWSPDLNVTHVICQSHCQRRETIPWQGVCRVLKNTSRKMPPSKCAKNKERRSYLTLFLIHVVGIFTLPYLNTINNFHLWRHETNLERWNINKCCHHYCEAGIIQKQPVAKRKICKRVTWSVERSLWNPLIDITIRSVFSNEISMENVAENALFIFQ